MRKRSPTSSTRRNLCGADCQTKIEGVANAPQPHFNLFGEVHEDLIEMEPIDELDETGATLRVLLMLHKEGSLSRTKLFGSAAMGKQAVYTALRVLRRLGLVGEERRKGS